MTLSASIESTTSTSLLDWPTLRFEIDGNEDDSINVPGTQNPKNFVQNIYLVITAPEWDKVSAKWKTEYVSKVNVLSENTMLTNSTTVKTIIGLYSNITVSYSKIYEEVEGGDSWTSTISIKNNTNGDATYDVELKITGEEAYMASFSENEQDTQMITLSPNSVRQVIVRIETDEYDLAGYHNITIEVKGALDNVVHDKSTITTEVEQFYEILLTSETPAVIEVDPNDRSGENFTEEFTFKLQNFGNGYDNVKFRVELHEKNEAPSEWLKDLVFEYLGVNLLVEYDPDELLTRTIDTLTLDPYNEENDPAYGESEVTITVSIPTDVDHGHYWFNLIAESEEGLDSEQDEENNNATIMVNIIKPDLVFSPEDIDRRTYDDDPSRVIENYRFIDEDTDYLIPRDEDEEEYIITLDSTNEGKTATIYIELVIDNTGDSTLDLNAVTQSLIINITHEGEDDFGDFITIQDATLYPVSPSEVTIEPGENATITFESYVFEWFEYSEDSEILYTFTVTVDKNNFIIEQNENNNVDSFELIIKHKAESEGETEEPDLSLVIMVVIIIIAVIIIVIWFMFLKKKPGAKTEVEDEEIVQEI
jgi:hypothetical protein